MLGSYYSTNQPSSFVLLQAQDPVSIINSELKQRFQKLNDYAARPNANLKYVELERKSYETLNKAAQKLAGLKRFSTWNKIETAIDKLMKQDGTIDSMIVRLESTEMDKSSPRTGFITVTYPF